MQTALSVLRFVFVVLEVLVIFNLLIIVHEWGHFLAARWRGLVVDRFGIWFGKPLWKKTVNGVQYSLGSIPAGGFVSLPQMAPMEAVEGKVEGEHQNLPPIKVIDKIIVALAGPVFSLGLAFVFATLVFFIGRPTTEGETTTTIGLLTDDSPALAAGLRPGDKVLKVDGQPVDRFGGMGDSISWRVIRSEGETIPFEVERDGKVMHFDTGYVKEAKTSRWGRAPLRQVLIGPKITPLVELVQPGSPAERAGIQPGDIISAVNGERIYNPVVLSEAIEAHPKDPVRLVITRAGREIPLTLQPKKSMDQGEERYLIGVQWDPGEIVLMHPSPVEQVASSVQTMGNMVSALFSPKSDVKAQHFSGPVGIMNLYYRMFQSPEGWRLALWFSVFFNVNLAILNMLPIPVLDGGHILLALIEGVRRKPIPVKILEVIQTGCALFIMGYMLYVTFFDVQDVFPGKRAKSPATEAAE